MSTHALFAYGTLMVPEIISAIVGRPLVGQPGQLAGYARFRIADRVYPAIVEAPAASVPGIVYAGLSGDEIERLDVYEGHLYERRLLPVQVAGQPQAAASYVLRDEHRQRLSAEPWDLEQFVQEHLTSYLERVARTARAP